MSFLSPEHLSNGNEVMTLNFCLFKIKNTNCVARTLVFRWSIQWSLATHSLTFIPSYVMLKQKRCALKIQGGVRENRIRPS